MKKTILSLIIALYGIPLLAQDIEANIQERLTTYFQEYTTTAATIGTCRLDSFRVNHQKKQLDIYAGTAFSHQPFRQENVDAI